MNRIFGTLLSLIFLAVSFEVPFALFNASLENCGRVSNCPCEIYMQLKYQKQSAELSKKIDLKRYPKIKTTSADTYQNRVLFDKEAMGWYPSEKDFPKPAKNQQSLTMIKWASALTDPPSQPPPETPLLFAI